MSMSRKIIRNSMRQEAELRSYKPSKFVHAMWEQLQIRLLGNGKPDNKKGIKRRLINEAKGTKPKKNWRMRIQAVVE